jgi:hypothetical protein
MIRNKFFPFAAVLMNDVVGDTGGVAAVTEKLNAPDAAAVAPPAPSDYVVMQPVKFHFKKEKLRDETGKEIGEGKKLPSASLFLPIPKSSYLVEVLQDTTDKFAKERALLMDAVQDIVYSVARGQINTFRETNKDTPVTMSVLNLEALDWTKIANMPKGERGTSVPSDEDIKAFLDSYLEVMPEATNKSKEKIENHVALFSAKFKKQRAQKELLEVFQAALNIYVNTVTEDVLEDNLPVVEYFANMLARYLKSEEKITMDDI